MNNTNLDNQRSIGAIFRSPRRSSCDLRSPFCGLEQLRTIMTWKTTFRSKIAFLR